MIIFQPEPRQKALQHTVASSRRPRSPADYCTILDIINISDFILVWLEQPGLVNNGLGVAVARKAVDQRQTRKGSEHVQVPNAHCKHGAQPSEQHGNTEEEQQVLRP